MRTTANIIETTNKKIITTNIQTTDNTKIETTNIKIKTSTIAETTNIELTSQKEENIETSTNIEEKPISSSIISPVKVETKTEILLTNDLRIDNSDKLIFY